MVVALVILYDVVQRAAQRILYSLPYCLTVPPIVPSWLVASISIARHVVPRGGMPL